MDENPYQSPVATIPGLYDHSLLRRFIVACLWLSLAFALIDGVSAGIYLGTVNPARWFSALDDLLSADVMRFLAKFGGAK